MIYEQTLLIEMLQENNKLTKLATYIKD